MNPAIAGLLPLLASRGFRASRWRLPWSRTWRFSDVYGITIEISRIDEDWRVRRYRHERGTNAIAVEGERWILPGCSLADGLKRLLPVVPWQVRLPDIARTVNFARMATT